MSINPTIKPIIQHYEEEVNRCTQTITHTVRIETNRKPIILRYEADVDLDSDIDACTYARTHTHTHTHTHTVRSNYPHFSPLF